MTTLATNPLFDAPAARPGGARGPAWGFGISLLVHAAIVAWLVHAYVQRPAVTAPAAPLEVRLRTAPPLSAQPAQPVQPAPPAAAPAPPRAALPRTPAAARRSVTPPQPRPRQEAPPREDSLAPARAREAPARVTLPAPAEADAASGAPAASRDASSEASSGGGAAPTVDIGAARLAARAIARGEGKSLVALPARKPVVDPNAEHQSVDPIEQARRKDCKTAYAGAGLLAVIPLVIDTVRDSGCKW